MTSRTGLRFSCQASGCMNSDAALPCGNPVASALQRCGDPKRRRLLDPVTPVAKRLVQFLQVALQHRVPRSGWSLVVCLWLSGQLSCGHPSRNLEEDGFVLWPHATRKRPGPKSEAGNSKEQRFSDDLQGLPGPFPFHPDWSVSSRYLSHLRHYRNAQAGMSQYTKASL